jgi:hypothetical protein
MPPVPTEVLDGDIKTLREDLHKLDVAVAELRQEVKDAIGIGKWVATLVVGLLITGGIGSVVTSVWWASAINTRMSTLEASTASRFDKLEASIARVLEQTKPPAPKPGP